MHSHHHRVSRVATWLRRVLGGDAGAGLLLIAVAVAAMVVANSPLARDYAQLFDHRLGWTPIAALDSLHAWINDALMTVFFFVVGLEIKRELIVGALSAPLQRRLPVVAAVAGMATPALCYLAIAGTAMPLQRGWAIPAATDIAFAMGVIGLLGPRVPPALRLFLLTVAIVDDLGAVAIIALLYTSAIALSWLVGALLVLAAMIGLNRWGVRWTWLYILLAMFLWYCVLHSGIHATVAGAAAALTVPLALDRHGDSPLLRLEHALVPWVGYLVVPLFGFANAGVALTGSGGSGATAARLPLAIAAGLFLGKQIGIFGAVVLADRSGFALRPAGASWLQLWGVAVLCGIGFTMSLFIAALAFIDDAELFAHARIGVLGGSLLSMVAGYSILRLADRKT